MERKEISVHKLEPNKFNPNVMSREIFDILCVDMKATGPKHELTIDPLLVSPKSVFYNDPKAEEDIYVIVDGEHRWNAAKKLGWKTILCEIHSVSEDLAKAMNYRRNKERGTLDPLKEAALFKSEVDSGLTQQKVAAKYNASRPYIANRLGLLCLDEKVVETYRQPKETLKKAKLKEYQENVEEYEQILKQEETEDRRYYNYNEPEKPTEEDFVPRGTISTSHLEAIATLPAEAQEEVAKLILERGWTVRNTEDQVQRIKNNLAREKRFKEALEKAVRPKCPACGSDPKEFDYGETRFKCSKPGCWETWEYMKTKKEVEAEKASQRTEASKEVGARMKEARENPRYIRSPETPDELHAKVAPWVLRKIKEFTEISRVSIHGKRGNETANISYADEEASRYHMNLSFEIGKCRFGFTVEPKQYKKIPAKSRIDMNMQPSEETREALRHFFSETIHTNKDPSPKVKPKPIGFSLKAHIKEKAQ